MDGSETEDNTIRDGFHPHHDPLIAAMIIERFQACLDTTTSSPHPLPPPSPPSPSSRDPLPDLPYRLQ